MKIKILLASAALVAVAMPALADSDWYIVQGADRHCQVVDQKPMTKTETVVGPDGVTYRSRTEAMTAMKTVKVCE
ncbi:MAG TPA: hypothetical protein VG308_19240 [Stellaceae bacterium]|jgi:hypothetical protein|nr:hypothetical protein [Stellaceae bacterium]